MLNLSLGTGPLALLCLGAHADDIEIGCGGTVLRLLAEHPGSTVRWVVFSGDDRRAAEARASASDFLRRAARAEVTLLRFRDGFFPFEGAPIKEQFERLKAAFAPSLVLTHHTGDAHQDHRLLAELAYNTWRDHLILEYEVPKMEGDLGNPAIFVPIGEDAARQKAAAIRHHFVSQHGRNWFAEETFLALMRLRGINAGAPSGYAEAFYCRRAVL